MKKMVKYGKHTTYKTADKDLVESLFNQDILLEVGELIKLERQKKGISQLDLGDMTGIDHKFIQRFEKGKENITLRTMIVLLDALGIQIKLGKLNIDNSKVYHNAT